jgi:cardiolipin synthase
MLTYGRILAVPLIVLCFFLEGRLQSSDFARWSALFIFVAASITDYFDGYLARAWQQTSNIGRMLDPIADKLLVATCLLLLAADTDRTIAGWSLWAAIIILCREILVSGLREYLAALKVSVPVTQLAKWKTASRWSPSACCWPVPRSTRCCPTRRRPASRCCGSRRS